MHPKPNVSVPLQVINNSHLTTSNKVCLAYSDHVTIHITIRQGRHESCYSTMSRLKQATHVPDGRKQQSQPPRA